MPRVHRSNFLCMVLLCLPITVSVADEKPRPATASELQARVDAVLDKVLPTVVALKKDGKDRGSGVIVSADGLVLSHGHHNFEPVDKITVILASGREVTARCRLIVKMPKYNCSLLRIEDEGNWPYAEMGQFEDVHPGDWCLHLGHPRMHRAARPPVPRMGSIVEIDGMCLSASCMINPNDSGGPLFDGQGRVIGICYGLNFLTTDFAANYASIKALRHAVDEFRDQDPTSRRTLFKRIDRQAVPAEWNPIWEPARRATVEITCAGKPLALGLIVDADGLILTKRSQLVEPIACRLSDERSFDATIVAASPALDLALLRVPTNGLPTIPWLVDDAARNGLVVIVPGPKQTPLSLGIISDSRMQEVPPERGQLGIEVEPTDEGLKVLKIKPGAYAQDVLQVGDVITRLNGSDVRTLKDFSDVAEQPGRIAGDRIPVSLLRNAKLVESNIVLSAERGRGDWERDEFSDRRSGFSAVMIHDAVIPPHQCGSALVDGKGRVIGLNIARAERHETLMIPAGTLLAELDGLLRQARKPTR